MPVCSFGDAAASTGAAILAAGLVSGPAGREAIVTRLTRKSIKFKPDLQRQELYALGYQQFLELLKCAVRNRAALVQFDAYSGRSAASVALASS
jgi:hypothetical protein